MPKGKCCETCEFAKWQEYTPTGRIKKRIAGKCTFVVQWPLLPFCLDRPKDYRYAIWPEKGTDCPTYKEKA